ncbi:hypothetical protein ACFRKE_02505 [Kitasatospora indigofera]|uniref:hypothetical protein n=1 Tax=Kitasatospora indigofera TaxID=67307 RepID=UPI0036CAECA5
MRATSRRTASGEGRTGAADIGTPWGLLRHYWVLANLWLSTGASLLLLLHTGPIGRAADLAATAPGGPELDPIKTQLAFEASAALLLLLAVTALSVFKTQGLTRRGHRHRHQAQSSAD